MGQSGRTVLVVDDYAENRAAIIKMLIHLNVDILEAANGESALKMMTAYQPMLVLLDADMPGLDGYQIINKMHHNAAIRHLPVILMTSNLSDRRQNLHIEMLEIVDFIHKPIHELTLLSKIESHLAIDHYRSIIRTVHNDNEKLLEAMHEGVLGIDRNGVIRFANSAAAHLLKTRASKLQDTYVESLFEAPNHHAQSHWVEHPVAQVFAEQSILHIDEADFWRADGRSIKVKFSAVPIEDLSGVSIVLAFQAIASKPARESDLGIVRRVTDALTGLPCRPRFEDLLQEAIDRVKKNDHQLAVLVINLDHFRNINDSLGHDIGDKLLKFVSQRLIRAIRKNDVLGRIGGDEFSLLLEPLSSAAGAVTAAEKIINTLKEVFLLEGHEIFTSCSVGIATYPACGDSVKTLLQNADAAVAKAKEHGRNSIQYFSAEINAAIEQRIVFEREVCQALQKETLSLCYSPVMSVITGQGVVPFGLEVQLEWRHPRLGVIPASEFMGVAEEMGHFSEMTRWMCEEAFVCLNQKKRVLLGMGDALQNDFDHQKILALISLKQLLKKDFLDWLSAAMLSQSITGDQLILGMSEQGLLSRMPYMMTTLEALHALGIKFAIIDFGTGFGSFELMRSLAIDIVQLPDSFVRELLVDQQAVVICRHLIAMAHELGIKVWAKNVDSIQQYDLLRQMEVEFLQGQAVSGLPKHK